MKVWRLVLLLLAVLGGSVPVGCGSGQLTEEEAASMDNETENETDDGGGMVAEKQSYEQ